MENYLIDRETLSDVVDSLIARKQQPINNPELLREEGIKRLDDQISTAIFGQLNNEQLNRINALFENPSTDEATFQKFFEDAGINLEETITGAIEKFSQEFLGGDNE